MRKQIEYTVVFIASPHWESLTALEDSSSAPSTTYSASMQCRRRGVAPSIHTIVFFWSRTGKIKFHKGWHLPLKNMEHRFYFWSCGFRETLTRALQNMRKQIEYTVAFIASPHWESLTALEDSSSAPSTTYSASMQCRRRGVAPSIHTIVFFNLRQEKSNFTRGGIFHSKNMEHRLYFLELWDLRKLWQGHCKTCENKSNIVFIASPHWESLTGLEGSSWAPSTTYSASMQCRRRGVAPSIHTLVFFDPGREKSNFTRDGIFHSKTWSTVFYFWSCGFKETLTRALRKMRKQIEYSLYSLPTLGVPHKIGRFKFSTLHNLQYKHAGALGGGVRHQ